MHQDDLPPLEESGSALYLAYLILPIQHHDEDNAEEVRVIPMILSRN